MNTSTRATVPTATFSKASFWKEIWASSPHSRLQNFFSYIFRANRDAWRLRSLPEQRVQVQVERYRVADIAVIALSDPADRILRKPPAICIEILSSSDSLHSMQERVDDYAAMGVPNIWVLDPWKRLAYYASVDGYARPSDGTLRTVDSTVAITLADIFAELDEA